MVLRPARTTAPSQVSHLNRLLENYGRDTGVAPSRARRWITTMVTLGGTRPRADRPEAAAVPRQGRGRDGTAACARQRARRRDLDMVFLGETDRLLAELDAALAEPYSLFSFERRSAHGYGRFPADPPAEPVGRGHMLA